MDLVLFGLNHVTAPLEVRERLSFKKQEANLVMRELREEGVFAENLLLSTCNRTEIYGLANRADESLDRLRLILSDLRHVETHILQDHGYTFLNVGAVQHLFRVAAGLDSLVIGEVEILGQVKDAYRDATGADTSGPFLNRLFQHCFRVGKRARTETGISDGAISVGSIAVELALKVLGRLDGKTALLIGAGETGRLVATHLISAGIGKITVTNRTKSKADELALELGGTSLDFGAYASKVSDYDLVVTAVGAPERTVTRSMLKAKRGGYPLLIDLGVPRDIDPEIDKLSDAIVYNIDDLESLAKEKIERRMREVPRVEKIILDETTQFIKWYDSINAQNTITDLRMKLESLQNETLEKWSGKLNPQEMKAVERVTGELLNKILHLPSQSLKGCELGSGPKQCENCDMYECGKGPVHGHYNQDLKCMTTRQLFGLEEKNKND
jgi:glutamyl-tRNA reductase